MRIIYYSVSDTGILGKKNGLTNVKILKFNDLSSHESPVAQW